MIILNKYIEGENEVIEYSKDGSTVSHTVTIPIQTEPSESAEPYIPVSEKIDSLQSDNLTQFEVLATVYEEMSTSNLTQFEVMATMYEELIELRSEVEQLKGGSTE